MSLTWCEAEMGLGDARAWLLVNPLTSLSPPKHLVGRLIGKQGRYVSFLKQTSGAKIYISTLPYTQNIQVCHIEGQWQPLPGFYATAPGRRAGALPLRQLARSFPVTGPQPLSRSEEHTSELQSP